jgi:hypothetical protein
MSWIVEIFTKFFVSLTLLFLGRHSLHDFIEVKTPTVVLRAFAIAIALTLVHVLVLMAIPWFAMTVTESPMPLPPFDSPSRWRFPVPLARPP